jgi:hypothetical protein
MTALVTGFLGHCHRHSLLMKFVCIPSGLVSRSKSHKIVLERITPRKTTENSSCLRNRDSNQYVITVHWPPSSSHISPFCGTREQSRKPWLLVSLLNAGCYVMFKCNHASLWGEHIHRLCVQLWWCHRGGKTRALLSHESMQSLLYLHCDTAQTQVSTAWWQVPYPWVSLGTPMAASILGTWLRLSGLEFTTGTPLQRWNRHSKPRT